MMNTFRLAALSAAAWLIFNFPLIAETGQPEPVNLMIEGADVIGDARARVTLIEYSDYQCPYCARHYRQTMPAIRENYIETGKVKFVVRQFPIPNLKPRAAAAAVAALCAGGQGRLWEMHGLLFDNQQKVSDDDLRGYAAAIGLDVQKFSRCLERKEFAKQIERDMEEGNMLGVRGTPSFVIGLTDPANPARVEVVKLLYGARKYEYFAHAIDEVLAAEGFSATGAELKH